MAFRPQPNSLISNTPLPPHLSRAIRVSDRRRPYQSNRRVSQVWDTHGAGDHWLNIKTLIVGFLAQHMGRLPPPGVRIGTFQDGARIYDLTYGGP
jgi:hypothetical protein